MKKFKANAEAAEEKQHEALELLEQGILQLSEDDNWQQYLKIQSRFHHQLVAGLVQIGCEIFKGGI